MKEKIIQESIQLFGEKGFKETSIQDIVDALSVTKGTFYYYYKSKTELLMAIHLKYIDELLRKQEEIIHDGSKPYKQKLHEIVYMLIHDIEKEGLSAKVFFREMRNLTEEDMAEVIKKRDQFRLNIQQLLEAGIGAGEFRSDLPMDIVTFGILGMTNWSYFWFDPNGRVSDAEVSDIFLKMVLQGLKG
ncbi:TetR/AcrR family transcriptional regulator [Metabacillus indicus]|uniref:TetR family transcriptional regulator n=1 Tax=Metabacillus indicus TaxID=246786 RepID=A0A084H3A6_METID|nr:MULTISPECIES: TetR/AcrR family transcriptional regulator [Metabacillus]KEZ54068.1 TetR family transcriptional regulator [Metabacillus indicus]MDX8288178.1 TetR/AcrR family transcriptional regulator [Metabacillus indicus]